MTEYNFETVVSKLQAIVDAKGADHVYQQRENGVTGDKGCMYVYGGQPDCLVGHLLVELGVPGADLDYLNPDREEISEIPIHAAEQRLEGKYGISFSPSASSLLSEVQSRQDRGYAWGEALTRSVTKERNRMRNH